MKILRTSWLSIVGVLLLLFAGILGNGAIRASAQSHHGMHEQTRTSSSNCQSVCNSMTGVVPVMTKRDEEEQDDDPQPIGPHWLHADTHRLPFVRKIGRALESMRLLRPPDIFAVGCAYRF